MYKWKWMMLGALRCMNNVDFEKKKLVNDIAYHVHFSSSVSACGTLLMQFYADEDP